MKTLSLVSRRKRVYVKFFSKEAKVLFKEEIRNLNETGATFLKLEMRDIPVPTNPNERYLELSKAHLDLTTLECFLGQLDPIAEERAWKNLKKKEATVERAWESAIEIIANLSQEVAFYSYSEYDCMYYANPTSATKKEVNEAS